MTTLASPLPARPICAPDLRTITAARLLESPRAEIRAIGERLLARAEA